MYTPTSIRFLLKSEGLEIVADKVSQTPPEVNYFNEFVNKKSTQIIPKKLKILLEYYTKNILGNILGKKKQEQFANAYTVLTKKSDQNLHIF